MAPSRVSAPTLETWEHALSLCGPGFRNLEPYLHCGLARAWRAAAFVLGADELNQLGSDKPAIQPLPLLAKHRFHIGKILAAEEHHLQDEFTRRLDDAATVLTAQCDAAGGAARVVAQRRRSASGPRSQV